MNKEILRTIKFTLFSISAGIIQFLSFTLLNEVFEFSYWICYLVSLVLSVVWNFTLNRNITFKSASNVPIAMIKVAIYYLIFIPLSTFMGHILVNRGINEYIVEIISMLLNFVTEYLYDRFYVFKDSIDTK